MKALFILTNSSPNLEEALGPLRSEDQFDLTQPAPDYQNLLERIFQADSIHVL